MSTPDDELSDAPIDVLDLLDRYERDGTLPPAVIAAYRRAYLEWEEGDDEAARNAALAALFRAQADHYEDMGQSAVAAKLRQLANETAGTMPH
jgi:hypothetical protein